ncbi:hypothetical protein ACU686_26340 [Yinghuangia aomiensis]
MADKSKTLWELQAVGGCLSAILIPENLNVGDRACEQAAHPQQRNGCLFVWAIARHNALTFRPGGIWFVDVDLIDSTNPEPQFGHYPDPSAAPPATPPASGAPAPGASAPAPTPQPTETKRARKRSTASPSGARQRRVPELAEAPGSDVVDFAKDPCGVDRRSRRSRRPVG